MSGNSIRASLSALLLFVSVSLPARAADTDAAGFISNIGNHGIQILQGGADLAQRKVEFSKIFTQDFDVPAIGKFVLGQYWRTATPDQQQQYLAAFGQYIVSIYAERFSNYQGEKFTVTSAEQKDAAMSVVHSQLIRPNGAPPMNIDWQVAKEGDSLQDRECRGGKLVDGANSTAGIRLGHPARWGQHRHADRAVEAKEYRRLEGCREHSCFGTMD